MICLLNEPYWVSRGDPIVISTNHGILSLLLLRDFNLVSRFDTYSGLTTFIVSVGMTVALFPASVANGGAR